jgi:hypothetical protein
MIVGLYSLGSTHDTERWCLMLYGISVSTMWLRILNFVLVQKDLGKVLERCRKWCCLLFLYYYFSLRE